MSRRSACAEVLKRTGGLAGAAVLLLRLGPALAAQQEPTLGRYEARTIVTGTDLRGRPSGFAACLRDVLIKVSGDPTLAEDPRLPALTAQAGGFVTGHDYWDRMSGIPHHDEQGSSDRPYNLTVRFDPARIASALGELGRAPWPDPRPGLVLSVEVEARNGSFALTEQEPRAADMRAAIAEAGQKFGMAVTLPAAAGAARPPGGATVTGSLVLSEAALGWVGTWHLDWQSHGYDWRISGVNFDAAFRNAVSGAMQVLSGHGAPPPLARM
jgi:hypothetical protein